VPLGSWCIHIYKEEISRATSARAAETNSVSIATVGRISDSIACVPSARNFGDCTEDRSPFSNDMHGIISRLWCYENVATKVIIIIIIIIIIIFIYYSCSHNVITESTTSVTQDSTDTIEHKASIYNET